MLSNFQPLREWEQETAPHREQLYEPPLQKEWLATQKVDTCITDNVID